VATDLVLAHEIAMAVTEIVLVAHEKMQVLMQVHETEQELMTDVDKALATDLDRVR
jgi:hypothetical protein